MLRSLLARCLPGSRCKVPFAHVRPFSANSAVLSPLRANALAARSAAVAYPRPVIAPTSPAFRVPSPTSAAAASALGRRDWLTLAVCAPLGVAACAAPPTPARAATPVARTGEGAEPGAEPDDAKAAGAREATESRRFLVGSGYWGEPTGGALTVYELNENPQTGAPVLTALGTTKLGGLPSFLVRTAAPDQWFVADEETGTLRRVALDGNTLRELDSTPTESHPVYLTRVERAGRQFLLAASYDGGIAECWPIDGSGRLGARSGKVATGAHAHSIVPTPDGAAFLVPNEGADSISVVTLDAQGALTLRAQVPSTAGPRHLAFRGDVAYVTHERSVTVGWLRWDRTRQTLVPVGVTPSLAPASAAEAGEKAVTAAHVIVHADKLYVTVRAGEHSELVTLRLAPDGTPAVEHRVRTGGATPRHFTLWDTANGPRLLIGNQDGRSLTLSDGERALARFPVTVRPFFIERL